MSPPFRLSLGGSRPRVARVRLAGKGCVFGSARTLGFLIGEDDGLRWFVTGVVTPVGLHEHGVDLFEIDGARAVAHGFDEGTGAEISNGQQDTF